MASKGKQKKGQNAQQRKRKEQRRNKRKSRGAVKSSQSLIGRKQQQLIEKLVPFAWAGENIYDVAVFDEIALSELPDQDQAIVVQVIQALEKQSKGQFEEAEQLTANISRKHAMADWRMLIRGLNQWYQHNTDSAAKFWSRLDSTRRPARIANALTLAHCDNLKERSALATTGTDTDSHSAEPADQKDSADLNASELLATADSTLIQAAKVVRKIRIDRTAIKLARSGLAKIDAFEDEDLVLRPGQIVWLKQFASSFRSVERQLVRVLELNALEHASQQQYIDIYESAASAFPGPSHDPNNHLRSYFFHTDPDSKKKAERCLARYRREVASSNKLSEPLRKAILSQLALQIAEREARDPNVFIDSPLEFIDDAAFDESINERARSEFQLALQAMPTNGKAHQQYTELLGELIDQAADEKQSLKPLQQELFSAMQAWTTALPDVATPRLYLTENLLNNSQFSEAEPHIEWLMAWRSSDPRISTLSWKLQLLKAMHLCRRQSSLSTAREQLDDAISQWPDWLSADWQPYLRAALSLRCGDEMCYQKQRADIIASSEILPNGVADTCMMLAAAQKLHVPANLLKPLRQAVEEAIWELDADRDDDVTLAGNFLWTLYQAGISSPALRKHRRIIGQALLHRILGSSTQLEQLDKKREYRGGVLWTSEHRFWMKGTRLQTPTAIFEIATESPTAAAATLNNICNYRFPVNVWQEIIDIAEVLEKSLRTEADLFLRAWYTDILDKYRALKQKTDAMEEFMSGFSNKFFGDEDDMCYCPDCVERRARERSALDFKPEPELADQFAPRQTELF